LIDVIHPGKLSETHLNQRRVRAATGQLNLFICLWVHCSLSLIIAAVPFGGNLGIVFCYFRGDAVCGRRIMAVFI